MNAQTIIDHVAGEIAGSEQRILSRVAAGLTETRNGLRVAAARPVPIIPNRPVNSGPARLVGWSVRASGGPATLTVYDSRDDSGDVLAVVQLATDGATGNHWMGPAGVSAGEAVSVYVTGAGTVTGSLYLGSVD
jgi:hypothetical protein